MSRHEREISIVLNRVSYTYQQVIAYTEAPQDTFEKNTLAFCKAWIQGKDRFTIATSGSTGIPKQIVLTRKQMIAAARKVGTALQFNAGYRALVCLDSRYIAGQMMLVRCFVYGMKVYAVTPSANPLSDVPENTTIDVAAFVPYQLEHILRSKNYKRLNDIRCILIGGAPIDPLLLKKITQLSGTVYATYGMTETAAAIALRQLNGATAQSCFQSLPNVLVSQSHTGCLVVEADHLAGKIVTQDLVEMKGAGRFEWLGRRDNVINSGGVKVIPERIEQTIRYIFDSLRLSNNFFIAGQPDRQLGEKVCLIVEGNAFAPVLMQKVMHALKTAKNTYTMPKELYFIERFIATPSGKTDRMQTVLRLQQARD